MFSMSEVNKHAVWGSANQAVGLRQVFPAPALGLIQILELRLNRQYDMPPDSNARSHGHPFTLQSLPSPHHRSILSNALVRVEHTCLR